MLVSSLVRGNKRTALRSAVRLPPAQELHHHHVLKVDAIMYKSVAAIFKRSSDSSVSRVSALVACVKRVGSVAMTSHP